MPNNFKIQTTKIVPDSVSYNKIIWMSNVKINMNKAMIILKKNTLISGQN
jgi:hypothetical protein